MSTPTFTELYSGLINDVFRTHVRTLLEQGADAYVCADTYAEQGKPDFVLAFLLSLEGMPDSDKCSLLAHAYERRATLTDEKADSFDREFHRPFPLVKLEAQKDRMAAQQIRQKRRVRRESKTLHVQ